MAFATARAFLIQECVNLREVLEATLRFKYGLEGSREFFEECQARLEYVRLEVNSANEDDVDRLRIASALLCHLSDLVSRIERSSIGEYSWPFVEELKRIAAATCTEATASTPNAIPQFHVWSSGGLDAYAIQPEQNRPSGSRKRIHTIVLPKTLKHYVLLHSILGHEVGHAMFRCSKHQSELTKIVNELLKGTAFSTPADTARWLYSPNAPDIVKKQLASPELRSRRIDESNFFPQVASWSAWMEEILCDFIGLVTFGPSFVAAECNLLYSMDPSGAGIGQRHPLVGCRANYLSTAAKVCGFDSLAFQVESHKTAYEGFWRSIGSKRQADAWFDVFPTSRIEATIHALRELFLTLPPALYATASTDELGLLLDQLHKHVPPVGYSALDSQEVRLQAVDFRHILYAGWIAAANDPTISFSNLNRLCEHAIMQQRAISIEIGSHK